MCISIHDAQASEYRDLSHRFGIARNPGRAAIGDRAPRDFRDGSIGYDGGMPSIRSCRNESVRQGFSLAELLVVVAIVAGTYHLSRDSFPASLHKLAFIPKFLAWIGFYSYSIYLWHVTVGRIADRYTVRFIDYIGWLASLCDFVRKKGYRYPNIFSKFIAASYHFY